MGWKKYFTPVKATGQMSPISGGNGANPSRTNYSSFLPDVYSGHPNRLERYSQLDTMDNDPEVNAALDILAEFCTQVNEENQTPFHIFFREQATPTEIKIIKKYLQQWSKLNKFGTRMFKIIRNTFKYGDSFFIRDPETLALFYIDPAKIDKIIVNESEGKEPEQYVIRDLNVNFQNLTVTQINPSNQNTTPGGTAYVTGGAQQRGMVGAYPQSVGSRFGVNQNQVAIEAKHVAHLSMSEGLDNNFPFGNSLLESVFKVYKQKELLEDAIIIYRIQRAPERRIFYIDVGNMPSHLAMSFVERVKQEVNQRRIPSISGGGCFSMDTRVPLLDGRILSISDLANEYNEGRKNWAYSCDPTTGKMVPGIISWAGVTQESAEVIELELDNGEKITCTPEHKFPVHGKGFIEAKSIVVGQDSLFSFNTRSVPLDNRKKSSSDYNQVYDHEKKDWLFTHRVVANFFKDNGIHKEMTFCEDYAQSRKSVIHHADFNRYNNSPDNLVFMYYLDHIKYHSTHSTEMAKNRTPEEKERIKIKSKQTIQNWTDEEKEQINQKRSNALKSTWENLRKNPEKYQDRIKQLIPNLTYSSAPWQNQQLQFSQELFDIFCNTTKNSSNTSLKHALFTVNNNNEFMALYRQLNQPREKMIYKLVIDQFTNETLWAMLKQFGYTSWRDFLKSKNKKIQRHSRKLKWDPSMLKLMVDEVFCNKLTSIPSTVVALQNNKDFMDKFNLMNSTIKGNAKPGKFTQNTLKVFINDSGFKNWLDFKKKLPLFNHKIVAIRKLEKPIQVGTLTIDNDEKYHNYHTFAIEQGVYTKNSSVIDASYNPLAVGDDYFFPTTSEGRGSKVDTLPGGTNLGEISDLLFFTQKLMRALRIPSSYLPTGVDDSQNTFNDGRVGTAYIQELRFNNYCERLQSLVNEQLDREFKMYLDKKGINIDFNLFDLKFNPPQNFAAYRQAEMDTARVTVYGSVSQIPHLSKRFALKRFLGLTAEEMAENEQLWREENIDEDKDPGVQSELRSAGITPGGLSSDLTSFDQAGMPPPDMQTPEAGAANMGVAGATPGAGQSPGAPTI